MIHRLTCERGAAEREAPPEGARRFVIHRHRDDAGAHLDLRLEQDGYLMGFRIEGERLEGTVWGTVKAPHPLTWLEQDGSATREDAGTYCWDSGDAEEGVLVLYGARETVCLSVAAEPGVSAASVMALRAAADSIGVSLDALAGLGADGQTARERAITRYCALGRELDGAHFDEGLWRKTLSGERLAVIQQYLHGLEVRFDRKYPPGPVSKPVALEMEADGAGAERAMGILRG